MLASREWRERMWGPFAKRRCEATVQSQDGSNRCPKLTERAANVGDRLAFTPTLPKI